MFSMRLYGTRKTNNKYIIIYIIKQEIIFIYMLPIAGQLAGPIGLKLLSDYSGGCFRLKKSIFSFKNFHIFFHGQRRALQLVQYKQVHSVGMHIVYQTIFSNIFISFKIRPK